MATFSSKKLSEVLDSLLHMDDGSGGAVGMSGASTNREMRTGDNDATPLNMTTTKVSINKSSTDALSPVEFNVLNSAGTDGGSVFCNKVISYNANANTGGRLYLKDGNASDKSTETETIAFINQLNSSNERQLLIRDDSSLIMTAMKKEGNSYVGIGTSNPTEALDVNGKIRVEDTVLGGYQTKFYVNSKTTGTYAGNDTNDGSKYYPYKTLEKAMSNVSPYGQTFIYLYAGTSGSDQRTYNIIERNVYAPYLRISTVDVNGAEIGSSDASMITYRDNTFVKQTTTNDMTGQTENRARWDLINSSITIWGVTIQCTFPQSTGSGGNLKTPFRITNSASSIRIGRWTSGSVKDTLVKFMNPNYDSDGSTANFNYTCLVMVDHGFGDMTVKNVRWEQDGSVNTAHGVIALGGPGHYSIQQSQHEYPSSNFTDQYSEQYLSGSAGTSYS